MESVITSEGPLGVGTTFTDVAKFLGRRIESVWEITEYDPNRKVSLKSISSLKPPPFRWKAGFNAIPGTAIIPHFDDPPGWVLALFKAISFSRPSFVGIEGHTALVASDGKLQAVGKGGVTIWGRGVKKRYESRLAEGSPSEIS